MADVPSRKLSRARPEFTQENYLCSDKVGGKILFATDDYFAIAENMLKTEDPIFNDEYTEFGKWMDGWETRRKRIPGHDWCIIQLGIPGKIDGVDIDTSFFTGNYAPAASIQAANFDKAWPERKGEMGTAATEEQYKWIAELESDKWEEILVLSELEPGYKMSCHNYFAINVTKRWTHLRLNIYPDGGIARLRLYGQAYRDWSKFDTSRLIDLVALENGGVCYKESDSHFGHPRNIIRPGRALNMADGWETARKPDRPYVLEADENGILKVTGTEWSEFHLGHLGVVHKVEVDTYHFKGNFPDSFTIEACYDIESYGEKSTSPTVPWTVLLPSQKLSPHAEHSFGFKYLEDIGPVTHVRVNIAPDGGISRMRLWGYVVLTPGYTESKSRPKILREM